MSKPLGEILRELRREKKIGQHTMAELSGFTFSEVCRIENGRIPITEEIVTSLAPHLGASLDLLLLAVRGQSKEKKYYDSLNELVSAYISGELDRESCPLIIDLDASVVLDEEGEELFRGSGREKLCEEALVILGVSWRRP